LAKSGRVSSETTMRPWSTSSNRMPSSLPIDGLSASAGRTDRIQRISSRPDRAVKSVVDTDCSLLWC
jgi:hypothetical protein